MSKKEKVQQAPLSLEDQIDQLSQALLREYMHKKQFRETLKTFDEENPRTEKTISSRALMAELMHLSAKGMSNMKSIGIDTIMEMLCHIRLEKAEQRPTVAPPPQPFADPEPDPEVLKLIDSLTAEVKKMKKMRKKEKKSLTELKSKAKAEKKESKKKNKGLLSIDELLAQDDSEKLRQIAQAKAEAQAAKAARSKKAQVVEEAAQPADSDESSSSSSSSEASEAEDDDYASAMRKIKEEDAQTVRRRHSGNGWDHELETEPSGAHSTPPPSTSPQRTSQRESPGANADHMALGAELAASLKECLVGNDRKIPMPFIEQGFYFSKYVDYGLEQRAGGPCGVLAVVQALIVGDLFSNRRMITDDVLRNALVTSVSSILMKITTLPNVVVVSDNGHSTKLLASTNKEQLDMVSRLHQRKGFDSRQELEFYLAEHLRSWMKPNGIGLLCLTMSAVLSRTIVRTKADMDVELPLIVDHGYCSQELVNLLLCGKAVSNVHDGTIQQGEIAVRGLDTKLDVGFLSYMEHRKLLRVGKFGKEPKLPVWVVNHESHYTTLFMKGDTRAEVKKAFAGTHSASFDLFFWDQLGGQDEEIRLTATLEESEVPPPGKGVIVPYLNDIIRTVEGWTTARISWNGTDPLL